MQGLIGTLRENVWHVGPNDENSFLQTTDGVFEVPTVEALEFLKIRSHLTGHISADEISLRSGVSKERILSIVDSLDGAGLFKDKNSKLAEEELRQRLVKLVDIWSNELKDLYIANKLPSGSFSKSVLVGWLLEMFHYIRSFPDAIEAAARSCSEPSTKDIIQVYADQEKGHEEFVVQTLVNLGLKRDEILTSHPLPSTQLIVFLMNKLLQHSPTMVFAMAKLVESQEFDENNISLYKHLLSENFSIPEDALDPYFLHQEIDTNMGHGTLMDTYLDRIDVRDTQRVSEALNILHDLKHAFELQTAEIVSYYDGDMQGRYIPRQAMTLEAL